MSQHQWRLDACWNGLPPAPEHTWICTRCGWKHLGPTAPDAGKRVVMMEMTGNKDEFRLPGTSMTCDEYIAYKIHTS